MREIHQQGESRENSTGMKWRMRVRTEWNGVKECELTDPDTSSRSLIVFQLLMESMQETRPDEHWIALAAAAEEKNRLNSPG